MRTIDAFQQEVQQATRRFVAELVAAAQRAAHGIAEATINAAVHDGTALAEPATSEVLE